MATLTAAQRKRLPDSAFGLPERREYPMHDREHAANAKARARQELKKGNITRAEYARIVRKANEVERRTGGVPQ